MVIGWFVFTERTQDILSNSTVQSVIYSFQMRTSSQEEQVSVSLRKSKESVIVKTEVICMDTLRTTSDDIIIILEKNGIPRSKTAHLSLYELKELLLNIPDKTENVYLESSFEKQIPMD